MTNCPHCHQAIQAPGIAAPLLADPGALSTATERQEQRILEMLRAGPKTSPQLAAAGCVQYTARIFGLRKRGYVISMTPYDGYGLDNQWHKGLALYRLDSEPLAAVDEEAACS